MDGKEEKCQNTDPDMQKEVSFKTKLGYFDMTLIVDGHRIQVVKYVLCVASPVMESELKENNKVEMELSGKIYEDFVEFLSCLYPDKLKYVTEENVYRILPLVHEYQVDVLHQRCDKLICEILRAKHVGNPSEIYRHLQLSNTYNLDKVREKCIYLASELTTEQMEEGSSQYAPEDKQTLKIQLLALKRHQLDKADDMDILNRSSHTISKYNFSSDQQTVYCKTNIGTRISSATNCDQVLQAVRSCYRYPENANSINYLFSKLHQLGNEELKKQGTMFDLLPELAKKAWEKYCLSMNNPR